MTPAEFVTKWHAVTSSERSVAQTFFNELCDLLEVPKPLDVDPTGEQYTFERRVSKAAQGKGYADVWKRGAFAWENKTKGRDLGAAYRQLLLYRDDLDNPPLLVASDINRIEVHTNFTGTTKAVHVFTLDDLLDARKRLDLQRVWTDPDSFNPAHHRERVTEEATTEIGRIALSLRERGHDAGEVAHFMMQLVFALFAEDTGLLPDDLVSRILERGSNPARVESYLSELFHAMSTGGDVALEIIDHFNGGLFDGRDALPLTEAEIGILHKAASRDWAEVEPAIFGTLFERSLDPEKRSQLGAHYTSREDIMRVVQPVIIEPLKRRWDEIRQIAENYLAHPPAKVATAKRLRASQVDAPITEFLQELHTLRVLDPACGSGNFLYVALQALKDLEQEVIAFADTVGAPGLPFLGPQQFFGIEINPFAQKLASMVIWIGYLQWNRANGESSADRPILKPLHNIVLHDALMNEDGTEYVWPVADYIVSNPPFLGNYKLRTELGSEYVDRLFDLYRDRIPNKTDLVCYWLEKARAHIAQDTATRAGFITTNSIRSGYNRRVLDRISATGSIFEAWSDEPWILNGADVRVSIVCFDDGSADSRVLNGSPVPLINPDLTAGVNVTEAKRLQANVDKSFKGVTPAGKFGISGKQATAWLHLPNPSGVSNEDVLRLYFQGRDILLRPSGNWIVDFGDMPEATAQKYVVPYEHVKLTVKPVRDRNRDRPSREFWWRFQRTRSEMRAALAGLSRYIATVRHRKHHTFVWLGASILPGDALQVFATEDEFDFGVLHSRIHEVWALAQGSDLEDRPRYTSSSTFETFPFPAPTGSQRDAVSAAAKYLHDVREHLMRADPQLGMTKLYNDVEDVRETRDTTARAYPLLLAHEALDAAVAAAYGWDDWPLEDEEILARLLALNLSRPAA